MTCNHVLFYIRRRYLQDIYSIDERTGESRIMYFAGIMKGNFRIFLVSSMSGLVYNASNSMIYLQVVSVGFIWAGEAHNVIPESVTFGGTFRSLTIEGISYLMKRIKEVRKTEKKRNQG